MHPTFTLLRIRGIAIGANWTWLFALVLVAWSLAAQLFPRTYPGLQPTSYIAMGIVTAIVFFASVLLHELGHAHQALKEGMEIDGITLWILGGVARFRGMFPSPGAEARIAIAGPVVTLILALAFGGASWVANQVGFPSSTIAVTDYLARINVIVLGFNLVPALPLDGGRMLRAYLWQRQESFTAATMSASKAGRAFGILLIGLGILAFFTGSGLGGLWIAFIGWFILQAAQAEAAIATLKQALGGIDVADLMTPDPATVEPETTLENFLDDVNNGRQHSTFPVVGSDGELRGLMHLRLVGTVPAERRTSATVEDVMLPLGETPTVRPGSPVFDAIERLQSGLGRAVVVSNGHPIGIVSASDVARALEIETIRVRQDEPAARRAPWFVWVVVGVMMALAAAYLYRPPVVTMGAGPSLEVADDIQISGTRVDDINGSYLLTSVSLSRPNALGLGWAFVTGDEIMPADAVVPEGVEPDEYFDQQRTLFRDSQMIAAAAAAQSVGLPVRVSGAGAAVLGIAPGSPAAGALERGDVVKSVNGRTIETAIDLSETIRSQPAGSTFQLSVERDGRRLSRSVRSRDLPQSEGAVIGVVVQTANLEVDLPFEISFAERDVGGPSAGSAYALAIADMLDRGDYAKGRRIAATGTISIDGNIGPVGGVPEKAEGAEDAGATLFLVPTEEVEEARGLGPEVRGVDTLSDAIASLIQRRDV